MKKHLIYLASGNSSRFGDNKLLQSFGGKPLFLHGLERLLEVAEADPDCEITVVSRYPEIREASRALGVWAVDGPGSEKGVSYSIKAGIRSVSPCAEEDFLLFLCADQPHIFTDTLQRLLRRARPGTETAQLFAGKIPGNPVLFSAKLIPELLKLTGDSGGRAVLRRHPCIPVQAGNPLELCDIDTVEEMRRQRMNLE